MKKKLIGLFSILFLLSCNAFDKNISEQHHAFKDNTWYRFDKLNFEFPVQKDDVGSYVVEFFVKTTKEMNYAEFPFHLILKKPSGETRVKEFEFPLDSTTQIQINPNEYMLPLYKNISVNDTGKLVFSIEQLIPKYSTIGFKEAGITIKQQ